MMRRAIHQRSHEEVDDLLKMVMVPLRLTPSLTPSLKKGATLLQACLTFALVIEAHAFRNASTASLIVNFLQNSTTESVWAEGSRFSILPLLCLTPSPSLNPSPSLGSYREPSLSLSDTRGMRNRYIFLVTRGQPHARDNEGLTDPPQGTVEGNGGKKKEGKR